MISVGAAGEARLYGIGGPRNQHESSRVVMYRDGDGRTMLLARVMC